MITINDFSFNSDFKSLNLSFNLGAGNTPVSVKLYMGSQYGTAIYADLSAYNTQDDLNTQTIYLTTDEVAAIYTKEVFTGIFTIVIESSEQQLGVNLIKEASILNSYYTSIALANKILALDTIDKLNETNLMYLLLEASKTYTESELVEQALSAYEKVEAIAESAGDDIYLTDVEPCGEGLGCWIVNGVYVKK